MEPETSAKKIVDQMYNNDAFSQWLGIKRLEDGLGKSVIQMTVRPEMTNGFGIAHGGITYAFADSAFAFASNSKGRKSVSVETSISHTRALKVGEVITATATEESCTNKIGVYRVVVTNEAQEVVAIFKGVVYRTSKEWMVE